MDIGGIGSINTYAPTTAASASSGLSAAPKPSAKDEFLEWARMSPAERMRASMLSSMGLDEKKLAGMSQEDREKVEAKLREMIEVKVREQVEKGQTGVVVDQKV